MTSELRPEGSRSRNLVGGYQREELCKPRPLAGASLACLRMARRLCGHGMDWGEREGRVGPSVREGQSCWPVGHSNISIFSERAEKVFHVWVEEWHGCSAVWKGSLWLLSPWIILPCKALKWHLTPLCWHKLPFGSLSGFILGACRDNGNEI